MIAFESKVDHWWTAYTDTLSCACDLDLDPMTLVYELDLHILKIYLCTKTNLIKAKLDTRTDRVRYHVPLAAGNKTATSEDWMGRWWYKMQLQVITALWRCSSSLDCRSLCSGGVVDILAGRVVEQVDAEVMHDAV